MCENTQIIYATPRLRTIEPNMEVIGNCSGFLTILEKKNTQWICVMRGDRVWSYREVGGSIKEIETQKLWLNNIGRWFSTIGFTWEICEVNVYGGGNCYAFKVRVDA